MYYLFLEQSDQGCDYTIGCGSILLSLKGSTLEEAMESAEQYFDRENYFYGRGDHELSGAMILKFEADAMSILNSKLAAEKVEQEAETKRAQESQERAELERLQRKYQ